MKYVAGLLGLSLLAASDRSEIRGMRHPALSPDGKHIAFSWHGDLWMCSSEGGPARRLTDDPADEQKPCWSPDGKRVAFSSDREGNRDLFVLDVATRRARPLTFHSQDDDAPAWSPDGKWIAFQSNRDSNLDLALNNNIWDVWKMPAEGGTATRVTRFRGENPTWSPDGRWIAYDRYASGYSDGEHNIFLIAPDGSGVPRELAAGGEDSRRPVFRGQTVYFAHEANGIQTSNYRNLWRTTVSGGALVQVTGHRGDHVTWPTTAEKADHLVYEYDFDFYSVDLRYPFARPRKLFITADYVYPDPALPRVMTAGFRGPAWSPRGDQIAFACRGDLWVATPAGGDAKPVTAGVAEDRDPSWSVDQKQLVCVSGPSGMPGHLWIVGVEGGESRRITREEGEYRRPVLSPAGAQVLCSKTVDGETDLWVVDAATGAARAVAEERDVQEEAGCFSPDGKTVAYLATRAGRTEIFVRTLEGGPARLLKSDTLPKEGLAWSSDGKRLAYTVRFPDGSGSIRVHAADSGDETTIARRGAQALSWSPDSTMVLAELDSRNPQVVDSQTLVIFDTKSSQQLPVAVKASRPVTRREDMLGVFLQVWGSYAGHYYDPFFHGVDMAALRDKYRPMAEACQTQPELHDLINDMIRELHSSHIQLRPPPGRNTVATGSLAADLAREGDGTLRVRNAEAGGPAAQAGIREGEVIVAVGGTDLARDVDFDHLMTGAVSAGGIPEVRLAVRDAAGDVRTVLVKGLDRTALRELKYENRISANRKRVRDRSGGRLAYHHIKMMAQAEVSRLKKAVEEEFGEAEGLVLDERDGVGGLAHRPICAILDSTAPERLNAAPACWTRNRNGVTTPDRYGTNGRPAGRSWDKPVILIQNEISRSDKEIFPYTFRHLGIGYLVGMPTAGGVIGGSDWTMQDGSRITVSVQGWFTAAGRNMEGWGVPPDYRVAETHEDLLAGRDAQLEKAIEVLLAQMDGKIAGPRKGPERKVEGQSGK